MKINVHIGNHEYVGHKRGKEQAQAVQEARDLPLKERLKDALPIKRRTTMEGMLRELSRTLPPPRPAIPRVQASSATDPVDQSSPSHSAAEPIATSSNPAASIPLTAEFWKTPQGASPYGTTWEMKTAEVKPVVPDEESLAVHKGRDLRLNIYDYMRLHGTEHLTRAHLVFDPHVSDFLKELVIKTSDTIGPVFIKGANIVHIDECTGIGPLAVTVGFRSPPSIQCILDLDAHKEAGATPHRLRPYVTSTIVHELMLHARRKIEQFVLGLPEEDTNLQHQRIFDPEVREEFFEAIGSATNIFESREEKNQLVFSFYDDSKTYATQFHDKGHLNEHQFDEALVWMTDRVDSFIYA